MLSSGTEYVPTVLCKDEDEDCIDVVVLGRKIFL